MVLVRNGEGGGSAEEVDWAYMTFFDIGLHHGVSLETLTLRRGVSCRCISRERQRPDTWTGKTCPPTRSLCL